MQMDRGPAAAEVTLLPAAREDMHRLWCMQRLAFQELLDKYQDAETNPACESYERLLEKFNQPHTTYYFILAGGTEVGALRIVDARDVQRRKRIAPIFILLEYRNKGYAQAAIRVAEQLHGAHGWMLDTIAQETGNCHLYETLGYVRTGNSQPISNHMTIVQYIKD